MGRKRKFLIFVTTLIPTLALIYFSFVAYSNMQKLDKYLNVPNIYVYALVLILLIFLLVLILRFFLLLYFSILDVIETVTEKFRGVNPKVSIIVPAFNEEKVIKNSLRALFNLNYPNYEVIIINDGSNDNTLKNMLSIPNRKDSVEVKIINKPNTGKADSLNRGLYQATGELVVAVDADSKLDSQTLKNLVRHFEDPDVGAVAGNVKVINRNNMLTKLQALEYIQGLNLAKRAQSFLRIVNIIPGPLGMFRKRVMIEAGGYSNDTFAEDCDLTLKILSKNWKIKYEASAISYTEAPEGLVDLFKQRYRWTRGIVQSMSKHLNFVFLPFKSFSTSFTLWMMLFETIMWPIMNVFSNIFLIFIAIKFGFASILVLWWCILTLLDIAIAIHCITLDNEDFSLSFYAIFYRLFYIFAVDFCKVFALIEEMFGFTMQWGKVERKGRL